MYCNVVLFSRPISALTYVLNADVPVGAIVQVPIKQQSATGIITDIFPDRPAGDRFNGVRFRTILEVVDPKPFISEPLMRTLAFMSAYYFAPLGFCLKLAIPSGMMRDGRCGYRADIDAAEQIIRQNEAAPNIAEENTDTLQKQGENRLQSDDFLNNLRKIIRIAKDNPEPMSDAEWRKSLKTPPDFVRNCIASGLLKPVWRLEKKRSEETVEDVYALKKSVSCGEKSDLRLGKKQRAILDWIEMQPAPARHSALVSEFGACRPVLRRLEELGLIEKSSATRDKTSFDGIAPIVSDVEPTDEQTQAVEAVANCEGFAGFLLYGITGSGKTEVYLGVMERVLARNKGCIFVLPEIALTPQFCAVFKGRFGDRVAVLHSGLSETERFNTWSRMRDGRISVAIGPRSAIFAPIRDLGLIVVDEEHDGSFKQGEMPYYNARDMALYLGRQAGCPVILGSATPSLETYWRALQNRTVMLKLTRRPLARPMPDIEIVDMRNRAKLQNSNYKHNNRDEFCKTPDNSDDQRNMPENGEQNSHRDDQSDAENDANFEALRSRLISPELETALAQTLNRGEQAIIFLNRRGYSTFVQCDYCGHVLNCPNCDVSLTYYKYADALRCHYCGYDEPAPDSCPKCGRRDLSYSGFGTERVAALLKKIFPDARIDRLDRDRSATKTLQSVLGSFRNGQTDILVGTQMIAKGHDIRNVTLVGVVCADMGLNMPDFRAAERTCQLLAQVSGRAGRGNRPGRVIIQTLRPDHPAIAGQINLDYEDFARQELAVRRALQKPPFASLILVTFKSAHFLELERFASAYARIARSLKPDSPDAALLGPAPAPMAMIGGELHFQIFLQHADRNALRRWMAAVRNAAADLCQKAANIIHVSIDVDPYDMI